MYMNIYQAKQLAQAAEQLGACCLVQPAMLVLHTFRQRLTKPLAPLVCCRSSPAVRLRRPGVMCDLRDPPSRYPGLPVSCCPRCPAHRHYRTVCAAGVHLRRGSCGPMGCHGAQLPGLGWSRPPRVPVLPWDRHGHLHHPEHCAIAHRQYRSGTGWHVFCHCRHLVLGQCALDFCGWLRCDQAADPAVSSKDQPDTSSGATTTSCSTPSAAVLLSRWVGKLPGESAWQGACLSGSAGMGPI